MASHYAGGSPEEACQTETIELSFDNLYIPGNSEEFNINTILEVEDVIQEGELIEGEKIAAKSTATNFLDEYNHDEETLGIFLGYAENSWDSQQMWRNSEYGRGQVYTATEILEEEYGLIETDFGEVDLTSKGQEVHTAFTVLSEDEELLEST